MRLPPAAIDDLMMTALLRRHRIDDRLDPHQFLFIDLGLLHVLERADAGQHPENLLQRTHFPDLLELIAEILERKAVLLDLLLKLERLLLVDDLFGLFDQRQDVAHSHDPRNQPVRMEQFEGVVLFARTDKLHRLTGDLLDRKRRAAAGVAIHFGEDESVEAELFVELLRALDGVLSEHRVGDEQDFVRTDLFLDLAAARSSAFRRCASRPAVSMIEHVVRGVAGFAQGVLAKLERLVVRIALPRS